MSINNGQAYADLAFGFVSGINHIGPLIKLLAPDLKMTVKIVLEDVGKQARIDLGANPPKVEFGENMPPSDLTLEARAKDFHDVLLGKLNLMKGWNEKKILLELTPTAFSSLPAVDRKKVTSAQIPGFVYEMYIKSVGAGKILEESLPSASGKAQPRTGGFLEKISRGLAWLFGASFGLVLRLFLRGKDKKQELEKPAQVELKPVEELPKPASPLALPRPVHRALSWFFQRVDMFRLAGSFVKGALVTAPARGATKKVEVV